MRKRLFKYARRLLILCLVLGLLVLVGFSWICYWPWEGEVDDLMTLVPYRAEFVARMDYDGLMATGWTEANVEEDPLHPTIAEWVRGTGAFRHPDRAGGALPAIQERIAQLEEQINASIPINASWATFGVQKDVLAGETVIAGRWCAGFDPRQGPPSWQEILLLTRVSWRTKCIAALQHEFVREQVSKDPEAPTIEALDDDVYKLTFKGVKVSPENARSGCGRGYVMPPENVWYLHRVKDVIAFTNSQQFILQVAELGKDENAADSFASRPGFSTTLDPTGFVAASDLTPLQSYLVKAMEQNPRAKILGRYLRPRSIEKFSGGVTLESNDIIRGYADISYVEREAGEVVKSVYGLAQGPVTKGIASMVPAEDTFAALFLRSKPLFLLKAIYDDALTRKEKSLWNQNLAKMDKYDTIDDFFVELAEFMGDTSTVALSRLSKIYDQYQYNEFYADEPDPMQGIAIMLRVRHGRTFEELNAFLADRVPFLGFDSELLPVEYRGFTYTSLKLRQKGTMNERHLDPAYLLVQDHLIFVNNQAYLRQIIDTIADNGRGSLTDDLTFRSTMGALPKQGHVAAFIDFEKLSRVPRDANPESMPKGFLWDMRMATIRDDPAHDTLVLGEKWRKEIRKKYRRPLSIEDDEKVEEEVGRRVEKHFADYAVYAEEYRRTLEGLRRLGGFGFVFGATPASNEIHAEIALTLRDAEAWLAWRRK